MLVRPLLGLSMRATGDSLLGVALMHSMVNRTQNPDGIGAGLLEGEAYRLGFLGVLVVITGVFALVLHGRLGGDWRRNLDGREVGRTA